MGSCGLVIQDLGMTPKGASSYVYACAFWVICVIKKREGSESVTNCHQLKLEAADGKKHLIDAANAETILSLVQ